LLGILRNPTLLVLQIGALAGKATSKQSQKDLLRDFLGL
jgi:hypothetical protein